MDSWYLEPSQPRRSYYQLYGGIKTIHQILKYKADSHVMPHITSCRKGTEVECWKGTESVLEGDWSSMLEGDWINVGMGLNQCWKGTESVSEGDWSWMLEGDWIWMNRRTLPITGISQSNDKLYIVFKQGQNSIYCIHITHFRALIIYKSTALSSYRSKPERASK